MTKYRRHNKIISYYKRKQCDTVSFHIASNQLKRKNIFLVVLFFEMQGHELALMKKKLTEEQETGDNGKQQEKANQGAN